jgi:pimeloyl-ACP methyl ester carboxylesterase
VKIACDSCGDGDTTLLFVHGWCINKEYWQPQLKVFCPQYKTVAIDLPGFGQSGRNRNNWDFDAYADDVKNVIDQLKLKNVILIGHSMSGDIILKVSNKYPGSIIGIAGIDNLHEPGAPMTGQQKKEMNDFFAMLNRNFDSTVSKFMRASLFQPTTPKQIVDRVMNNVFTADSSIATKVLESLTETAQQEQTMMQGLFHKLYLINSDVLPVKTDSLAKYCRKGFKVELVHATGHYPMIEKPAEFNSALRRVIEDISKNK